MVRLGCYLRLCLAHSRCCQTAGRKAGPAVESWADVSSGGSGVFASQEMANVRKQAEHPHAVLESPLSQEVLGFRFHLSNYQNFSFLRNI